MKYICVFCGSRSGNQTIYEHSAAKLGQLLASQNITVVYGGGRSGLMGHLADSALKSGGRVIGVIPKALYDLERGHTSLTELHVVDSMHQRKALMAELAEAFIAMPGGFGTFEEYCEVLTWNQIGVHFKPCGLLNTAGYFDHLLAQVQHATEEGFSPANTKDLLLASENPEELLKKLTHFDLGAKQNYIKV